MDDKPLFSRDHLRDALQNNFSLESIIRDRKLRLILFLCRFLSQSSFDGNHQFFKVCNHSFASYRHTSTLQNILWIVCSVAGKCIKYNLRK